MIQCDSCSKWLDGQDEFFDHDEGTLCVECATEWYPDYDSVDLMVDDHKDVFGV